MRPHQRCKAAIRNLSITRHYTKHAEGSVLIELGDTKVICTASVEESVPRFLKGSGKGWVTAEYNMLPRSTHTRNPREAARGKQTGRTLEIQRLIARALRVIIDLEALGEHTITVDCDVIQADGGTRTASISGACVALHDALTWMVDNKLIKKHPMKQLAAAISVGIVNGKKVCDLEYEEDSNADTDMNIVMSEDNKLIEIQGTAEQEPFSIDEMLELVSLAQNGINDVFKAQRHALGLDK